jgi:hypothetical protein
MSAADKTKLDGLSAENILINGGFDFAQWVELADSTTYSTIANFKYGSDRWAMCRENAELQFLLADASAEAGLTCKTMASFKKITNNGKLLIVQPIESINTLPLRSKQATFSIFMKASAAKTIRMAVLELQAAGTADTFPTLISAWGANTTDPTFGANVAIITAAQSKSVTTSMAQYSITITVPADSKNLAVAVWSDSQFTANDILTLARASLCADTNATPTWSPKLASTEMTNCLRFAERISCLNTVNEVITFGLSYTTTIGYYKIFFKTPMRKLPAFTCSGFDQFIVWGANQVKAISDLIMYSVEYSGCSLQSTHTAVAFAGCTIMLASGGAGGNKAWIMFNAEISVG